MRIYKVICSVFALSLSWAGQGSAEPAELLGAFSNWIAYSSGSGSDMICYAMSKPRAIRPRNMKRGPIYFMITDWPARKVKEEPEIIYGYTGKVGGAAALGIGGDKFSFFIRNNGKEASSWLETVGQNERLIEAMQSGVSAVASGTSSRGAKTTDTYSLSGFNEALAKINAVCAM